MGSKLNSKRKQSDIPIIRIPIGITGESAGKGIPEIASEKCPSSFQERIEDSPLLKAGLNLTLKPFGERFSIFLSGVELGLLSKRNSVTIRECSNLQISYEGEIIEKHGEYYARFYRKID